MSKLTKKLSLNAETDVEQMERSFVELRRALIATEPPPDAEVRLAITVALPVDVQQRLPLEPAMRDRELAHIG